MYKKWINPDSLKPKIILEDNMTFHYPVKCKSCGIEFNIPFQPYPIPDYPRKDLIENFVCGRCGVKRKEWTEYRKEWTEYRKEWLAYLDSFR